MSEETKKIGEEGEEAEGGEERGGEGEEATNTFSSSEGAAADDDEDDEDDVGEGDEDDAQPPEGDAKGAEGGTPETAETKRTRKKAHTPPASPLPPTPLFPPSSSPSSSSSSSSSSSTPSPRQVPLGEVSAAGSRHQQPPSVASREAQQRAVAEAATTVVRDAAVVTAMEKSAERKKDKRKKKKERKKKKTKGKREGRQGESASDGAESTGLRTMAEGRERITHASLQASENSESNRSHRSSSPRQSRLRTYSERSGTMTGPVVSSEDPRTNGGVADSPPNHKPRAGSDGAREEDGQAGATRGRSATTCTDLRTGSLVLKRSPRHTLTAELALSPRSNSHREPKDESASAGRRHLPVNHKKPARIPGEKGSKVLRLQCPEGLGCQSTDADHFLKFQHTPPTQQQHTSLLRKRNPEESQGSDTTDSKGLKVSGPVLITPGAASMSSSSSASPGFLEKKVFFEKLGMKSVSMRGWLGKEKKKDTETSFKPKDDDGLVLRRICPLGNDCTSTDPHHFLTFQHTILNLDEKVKWINYTNTQSPSLHVSGACTADVVDEQIKVLSHAKARSDDDESEKQEESAQAGIDPAGRSDLDSQKDQSNEEQNDENREEKENTPSRSETTEIQSTKAEDSHVANQEATSNNQPHPDAANSSEEGKSDQSADMAAPDIAPPPVPPQPATLNSNNSGDSTQTAAPQNDLRKLVKAASRHILSREFRTSQLRMNKNSLIRRKVELEKRESVVREIVTTERNYIRILQAILDLYQAPLEIQARKKKWITEEQVKAIFYQIKVIYGLNSNLLHELEERTDERTWNENSVVGDIFVKMSSFLRVYASYNANYAKALLTLKQCKTNKKFNEFLESVAKSNEKKKQFVGSDLQSFLITPVQRIPRYIILLKMLQNHTMDDHPDFELISEALEKIEAVASENEKIHETSIQLLYLFQVQKKFVQANELGLVESHRRHVAEAEVVLHQFALEKGAVTKTVENPHKIHVRKIFIFNDIIIIAKEASAKDQKKESKKRRDKERMAAGSALSGASGVISAVSPDHQSHHDKGEEGKWRFMYQLDVESCQVESLDDVFDFISSKYTQRNAIRLLDRSSSRALRLTLPTVEEKHRLLDYLQSVISSVVRNLSSTTASGTQTNQRSSSYVVIPSGSSGHHGLVHCPSSNSVPTTAGGDPAPSPSAVQPPQP